MALDEKSSIPGHNIMMIGLLLFVLMWGTTSCIILLKRFFYTHRLKEILVAM